MTKTTGMLLGKFMPPHQGHIYLANFAQSYVDELCIVVGSLKDEPIEGKLRFQWIKDMFPNCHVVHLTDENPQYPEEHPDFWQIWHDSLINIMPWKPDYVFAGEDYGTPLAKVLGSEFIPSNMGRDIVPISATMIRNNPMQNWDYIAPAAQPYFLNKVCLVGAESTGKSTLAKELSEHFKTVHVPEYAYTLIKEQGQGLTLEDIEKIARGQIASEEALIKQANRVIICDTDLMTTTLWSHKLCEDCPYWIEEEAQNQTYNLTLLMDDDTKWVYDVHRYDTDNRADFTRKLEEQLKSQNRPYVKISGGWDERLESAKLAISELINKNV